MRLTPAQPPRRALAEQRGQRARRKNRQPRRPLSETPSPSEGPVAQESLPAVPLPPRLPRPPFHPASYPQALQAFCLPPSPQLRIPASPAGHVRPAPPVRAPPRGRSRPARGPLSRAAAAGWEPAARRFLSSARSRPSSSLPGLFPPPHPVRPLLQWCRARSAAQAVGPVSAPPSPGLPPLATQKGQEGPLCPRSAEEERGISPSPFPGLSPGFLTLFVSQEEVAPFRVLAKIKDLSQSSSTSPPSWRLVVGVPAGWPAGRIPAPVPP